MASNFRNVGVGSGSMLDQIGGIFATTVSELADFDPNLPPILFGSCAILSALLVPFLPETGGYPLPKDVNEIRAREEEDRKNGMWLHLKKRFIATRS